MKQIAAYGEHQLGNWGGGILWMLVMTWSIDVSYFQLDLVLANPG